MIPKMSLRARANSGKNASMNSVRVRVPATSANLGPGFDSLGVALRLYNTTTVVRGRGPALGDMAREAADLFFGKTKTKAFAFHWSIEGDVPRSRGLGSSVTVRLGVLHGLNELAGRPLNRRGVFELCSELEGHPDNAAPGAFGGFCVAPAKGPVQCYAVGEDLAFVFLIPASELETEKARNLLPKTLPLADAVFSVGNAAAIAGAFASGDYKKLSGCFGDRLHQPYRAKVLPFLDRVIEAGCAAGALGGWLSGAGSAVACATLSRPDRVANAMVNACDLDAACAIVLRADNQGARILK
jgi:homoserine kinase